MWRDYAAGAKNRFHDEGGDGVRPLKRDFVGEGRCAKLGKTGGIRLVERVAIGVGRRDVIATRQKRFVLGAKIRVSVDAGAADMRAVIALLQAEELDPSGVAPDLVILPRKAKRRLDAVAAAGRVEGALQTVWLEELRQLVRKLDSNVIRRAAEDRIIGKPVKLFGNGLFDRIAGEAEIDIPQAADGIDDTVAVEIGYVNALALGHDGGRIGLAVRGVRHRVPQVAGVLFLDEIVVMLADI